MKNIIAIFAASLLLFSCGSEDQETDDCDLKLWNLIQNGQNYYATYGETRNEAGTVEVNQETYEHYSGLGNVTNGSICWDGTRE